MSAGAGSFAALALLVALGALACVARRRRARQLAVLDEPLPESWRRLLQTEVRLYRRLPPAQRRELEPLLRAFLQRVPFVGCNGLEVDERMRLVIAAQACVLVLRRGAAALGALHGVMLYPGEFLVEESDEDEDTGIVTEGRRALSGQTVETDRIVLSWPDVEDARQRDDGYNVVVHEFAHFLDGARADWPPGLAQSLEQEYQQLCIAVERGEQTLLDPYGAEDPVEFFAVATEAFFELPRELRAGHPRLYSALRAAFELDPAAWPAAA